MSSGGISLSMCQEYWNLFVNRLAYAVQSRQPNPHNGSHFYYQPKDRSGQPRRLTLAVIRKHLAGERTVALYPIDPQTQRCKWLAIDADYPTAPTDLTTLKQRLFRDGIEAALEQSRRGGHLWLFFDCPVLARDCRLYVLKITLEQKLPLKGAVCSEGLEIFPKQDRVNAIEFGNGIRAPLGIHQASKTRYFFEDAAPTLEAQLAYLGRITRVSEMTVQRLIAGMEMPEEYRPSAQVRVGEPLVGKSFQILDHVKARYRSGRNYWARCPSCARNGHDTSGDNLSICVAEPSKYKCWAGCTREMIRESLGVPVRNGSRAQLFKIELGDPVCTKTTPKGPRIRA